MVCLGMTERANTSPKVFATRCRLRTAVSMCSIVSDFTEPRVSQMAGLGWNDVRGHVPVEHPRIEDVKRKASAREALL